MNPATENPIEISDHAASPAPPVSKPEAPAAAPTVSPNGLSGKPLRRAMTIVTVAWLFGAGWMNGTAGAPLTAYANALGLSNFEFGILAAMPFGAALLSLPASLLIDRSGQRQWIFLLAHSIHRLLWIPIAILPLAIVWKFGERGTPLAIFAFLSFSFLMHAGSAIGSPAWVSWMADLVPDRVRGRYFARRRQWGILPAIVAAIVAGWVVDRYTNADSQPVATMIVCAMIFCIATVMGVIDIVLFWFVPHEVRPKAREPIFRSLLMPLRDRRFAWFSLSTAVLWFAVAGQGQFVNKYLLQLPGVTNMNVQMMVLVGPALAQLIVLPIWGRVIDRFGKKPSMMIGILGLVPVGFGWCLMSGGHVWLGYVLAIAGVICWTGVEVANFNLVLELSGTSGGGKGGGSAYMAVNSVIVNIAGCLGGLFYGCLAEGLENFHYDLGIAWLVPLTFYDVLFAVSAVLRLAAVFALMRVHEPEARPTVDAFRFMAGNLYNNIVGAVLLPVRLIRRDDRDDD